jgi:hypothetical protein
MRAVVVGIEECVFPWRDILLILDGANALLDARMMEHRTMMNTGLFMFVVVG